MLNVHNYHGYHRSIVYIIFLISHEQVWPIWDSCYRKINLFDYLRWEEAADAYLSESWKRQVMWYVKDDAKLGMLDTDQKYRLEQTLERTAVSRKLLAFQVMFIFQLDSLQAKGAA